MAGSATITEPGVNSSASPKVIIWDWLSDGSGNLTGLVTTKKYSGKIVYVNFDPDAGGTQPDASYDVTIKDANGTDVLNGLGANLSQDNNVYKAEKDGLGAFSRSLLTLAGSGAGAANGGVIYLYFMGG